MTGPTRTPGPPMPGLVLAQLYAHPERFSDHPEKIRILIEDLTAAYDALRAVRVLHADEHICQPVGPPNLPRYVWRSGEPCPTAVIIDATLSGYGRGGPWPYDDADPER